MEFLNVLAAAAAGFAYGAVHYMALSKPWLRVSGVTCDENGRPVAQGNPALPFILSFVAMILVAGMMRHIFAMSHVETIGKAVLSGLGIGAFFIAPWTMINNAYTARPFLLTVIDGAYAIIGCGLMAAVLTAF